MSAMFQYGGRLLSRSLSRSLPLSRCYMDGMIPTTLSKVNVDDKAPLISSYGTRGFTVRGSTRLTGSVALLPKGYFHWKIKDASEIVPEALTLFTIVQPQLEIVVIGTGDKFIPLNDAIKRYLQSKGISVEVQDTANACATFNFLLDDGRLAGAALIPPHVIN